MVVKPFDEDAANAREFDIARPCTDCRMKSDKSRKPFELFTNRVRCFEAILSPPRIKLADLRLGEFAYLNIQR